MSIAAVDRLFPGRGRPARIGYAVALVAVCGVIAFALNAVYGFFGSSAAGAGAQRTATVAVGTVQSSVSASGNVSAANSASVDFGTSGTVTSVKVAAGDHVKAGQVLGTIDPTTAQTALEAAQANLAQAEEALKSAQGGPTAAQSASNASTLVQSQSSVTAAQQQLSVDIAAVATAKAQLKKDQALACPPAGTTSSLSTGSPSPGTTSPSPGATTPSSGQTAGSGTSSGGGATQTRNAVNATPTTTTTTATTTPAAPVTKPAVTTSAATNLLAKSATLNGTINPNGGATTYRFEYGTTARYGSKTAAVKLAAGTTATPVTAVVTGLKPDTAYLFRLVATNSSGTSAGVGQIARTAQSSCVTDAAAITSAQQTVTQQQAAVKAAEDNLTQTRATIAESTTPSSATIAQAKATVKQDEATVAAARQAVDETTLRAPIAGTITAVNGSVGSTVTGTGSSVSHGGSSSSSSSPAAGGGGSPGSAPATSTASSSNSSPFATIASLAKLEIVSGFAEADATKIAVGQPATITFPALPSTQVAGKVTAVSSTSTVVNNVVTYGVTIVLIRPPSDVKEGMTANVSVVDQTRENVLQLPSSAITTAGANSTVELLQNGKTTVTRVTTGLVGNSATEIVSGLAKGDVVVEPTVMVAAPTAGTTGGGFAGGGGGFGGGGFGGGGGFAGGGGRAGG
jgi:multidrug efflux pump subunit AcrA (membrane-fusion protein)